MKYKPSPDRKDAYSDTGCGGDCVRSLECPYAVCILDNPGFIMTQQRQERNKKILDMDEEGKTRSYIASEMGIGLKTVHRVLSSYRQNNR